MRILHTADWHVGKRLGRHDRMADHAAVLGEVIEIAAAEDVDLTIVAGDLFDRTTAPVDALRLVLDTLERLAAHCPVVAIAGNHDSPEMLELFAPLIRQHQVHLVGHIKRPGDGGVVEIKTGSERALVACLPFLREGKAVNFLKEADQWYGAYAERIDRLCRAYDDYLQDKGKGAVKLLTAHFAVHGVKLGGRGQPRGERALHLGEAYTATEQAIPPGPQYVAMGHIHAPQPVPGAIVPALYSGSLLELDFGESGEEKRVVLIEAQAGQRAEIRSIPVSRGRRLLRARGRFEDLIERPELQNAFVDLIVETDGPSPGLADRARDAFPHLVKVRAQYERTAAEGPLRVDQPWDDLYRAYYRRAHETEAPDELVAAFAEILDEVDDG